MTTAELLALPDDGRRRWLINGELRVNDTVYRDRFHAAATANLTGELNLWQQNTSRESRGVIVCGEAGVRLPGTEHDTTVGVDVAVIPPDVFARQTDEFDLIVGVPTLVVEIQSPSNRADEIEEKIDAYLAAWVPLVWVVNPTHQTVTIYRPGAKPTLVNADQELVGDPVLPGFRVPVARLFA